MALVPAADDFVLAPDRYADRQAVMFEQIAMVRALWRGERWSGPNGLGRVVELQLGGCGDLNTSAALTREQVTWIQDASRIEGAPE